MIIQTSGALAQRDGSVHVRTTTGERVYEIHPADGLYYGLVLEAGELTVFDTNGQTIVSIDGFPWTASDLSRMWVLPLRENVLIGSQEHPIYLLNYDAGSWTAGLMAWSEGPGGSLAQPYWPYAEGIEIAPSARTGSITVTADAAVFTDDYVGERIRYHEREILITAFISSTQVTGTVQQELPPTYTVNVASSSGINIGEFVTGQTSGANGLVTGVSGNSLTVIVPTGYTGFTNSERLVGPSQTTTVSSSSPATPSATPLWDEPMMSATRGYAGFAEEHQKRVYFCDFVNIPDAIAASSLRAYNDFEIGDEDDDAIIETVSVGSRLLYVKSAEDLILLFEDGARYIQSRDNSSITPTSFNPVKFDSVGAARIAPVQVNDGVVFVDKGGEAIMAAVLQGDQYRSWTVVNVSEFHQDLFNTPVSLGSTEGDGTRPERYVYAVNTDGTAAFMRWQRGAQITTIGWIPWDTDGSYVSLQSVLGRVHAVVDRTVGGATVRSIERSQSGVYLDNAAVGFNSLSEQYLVDHDGELIVDHDGESIIVASAPGEHLASTDAHYMTGLRYEGLFPIDAAGGNDSLPAPVDAQMGFKFEATITPWPQELADDRRAGFHPKMMPQIAISYANTVAFDVLVGDAIERVLEAYAWDGDVSAQPLLKTGRLIHSGFVDDQDSSTPRIISRGDPGPFEIRALFYQVEV